MGLLPVGQFHYPPGAPDMTLAGLQRRLAAMRAAVRYRNLQTGRKHYCHLGEHRARWAAGMRELRAAVKNSA